MKYFKNIAIIVPLAAIGITQAIAEIETKENDEAACSRYLVTASLLNVREQPGLTGDIIGGLPKGKSICVSSFSEKWAKIDKGWVSSRYIIAEPEVVEAIEVTEDIEPDSSDTEDEVKEETKDPATDKTSEAEVQDGPLEPEISPSSPQEENNEEEEEKKAEKSTDTVKEIKEVEKTEEAVGTKEIEIEKAEEAIETKEVEAVIETEAAAIEVQKTEELPIEKEDNTVTDYFKQIRTQEGVRGTNYIYMLEGNGDRCEIMVLEKNTILVNTCKPAINESGEKMLCTWNKKMCKTEAQILEDIKE